jgi:hypothetical protein
MMFIYHGDNVPYVVVSHWQIAKFNIPASPTVAHLVSSSGEKYSTQSNNALDHDSTS